MTLNGLIQKSDTYRTVFEKVLNVRNAGFFSTSALVLTPNTKQSSKPLNTTLVSASLSQVRSSDTLKLLPS